MRLRVMCLLLLRRCNAREREDGIEKRWEMAEDWGAVICFLYRVLGAHCLEEMGKRLGVLYALALAWVVGGVECT
jgi:hypothetical protein